MASTNHYHENTIPSDLSSMNELDPKYYTMPCGQKLHNSSMRHQATIEARRGTTPFKKSYVVTVRVTTYADQNKQRGGVTDVRVSNCPAEDVNHNNCEDAQYLAGAIQRAGLKKYNPRFWEQRGKRVRQDCNQRDAKIFTEVVQIEDAK